MWYLSLVSVPLAVAALAAAGYFFTALQLQERILLTVWLITAVVLGNALALRWLRLTHRQVMYAQLQRKRDAMRAERAAKRKAAEEAAEDRLTRQAAGEMLTGGDLRSAQAEAVRGLPNTKAATATPGGSGSGAGAAAGSVGGTNEGEQIQAVAEEAAAKAESIEPYEMNEQTRKLIRAATFAGLGIGLYLIWAAVLPALDVLHNITAWEQTVSVDGVEEAVPITYGALLISVLLLAATVSAARHLPGLLDLAVLSRFRMQAGTRYAVTRLIQYVIGAVGIIVAFNAIGFGWGRLQWLIAALSVGLGFGLQEIFANFISGLILLFERPIRVGDTVSVGDTTGVVTRIRIRATTITDLDFRELIVPNKEFITGQLINWSLSNPTIRLIIPVGVAYGSDTRLTQKLLLQVAKENRDVLSDPSASALFLGFGDNTLNFELRVYVKNVLRRFAITSDLHLAIDDAFAKAGITIAFPQRDLHLDTLSPLEVRVTQAGGGRESNGVAERDVLGVRA